MSNRVANAVAAAPVPAKSGSGQGTHRHDASGFGKALEAEGPDRGRVAPTRPDADTPAPSRWSRTVDLLSSTLVPATAETSRQDLAAATGQMPSRDGERALAESQTKLPQDFLAELPRHSAPELPQASTTVDADAQEQADAAAEKPAAIELAPFVAIDGDRQAGAPVDDPLAELKWTLAAGSSDRKIFDEPADTGAEDVDAADDEEQKAAPSEAPRTRVPEPLIYMAAIAPAEKFVSAETPAPAQAGAGENAGPVDRGRGGQSSAPTQAAPMAAAPVVADLATAPQSTTVHTPVAARAEPARPNAGEDTEADANASESTPPPQDKPREPVREIAAVATRTASPALAPVAPTPGGRPDADNAERQTPRSLDAGDKPDSTGVSNPAAPDPRRSGDQPAATPRVEVLADKTFVAPPAQPALPVSPTVTSLAGAIVASSASQRAAEAAQIGGQADANGTRTLQIQLNPADLGMVTAHLKASGERLSVELRVDTMEAYHRLTRDSDAITTSLKGHGYDIDTITILQPQAAPTPIARADTNPSATGTPDRGSGQPASGNSDSGGNGTSGQSSGRQDNRNFQGSEVNAQTVAGRTGDGVYI
jgi:flagellar hook-length control protein FliK